MESMNREVRQNKSLTDLYSPLFPTECSLQRDCGSPRPDVSGTIVIKFFARHLLTQLGNGGWCIVVFIFKAIVILCTSI